MAIKDNIVFLAEDAINTGFMAVHQCLRMLNFVMFIIVGATLRVQLLFPIRLARSLNFVITRIHVPEASINQQPVDIRQLKLQKIQKINLPTNINLQRQHHLIELADLPSTKPPLAVRNQPLTKPSPLLQSSTPSPQKIYLPSHPHGVGGSTDSVHYIYTVHNRVLLCCVEFISNGSTENCN